METIDSSIRSRQVVSAGLSVHILECGSPQDDLILLLHGFPELAFSWRKVLPLLARAGYHVVAPDMRGYGRTVRVDDPERRVTYDDNLAGFGMIDTIAEMTALVCTLHAENKKLSSSPIVRCVVGHDMGSSVAANLALFRPDIFKSLVMMSAPYTGPPSITPDPSGAARLETIKGLNFLSPPRKHYQLYFCDRCANQDLMSAPQGLAALYRGYYFYKSALWHGNKPRKLGDSWSVEALAQLPEYYVMHKDKNMAETVERGLADEEARQMIAAMSWMSEAELLYYVEEFERTGFQGGLNHYRVRVFGLDAGQLAIAAGKCIEVPTTFISGESDWGNFQDPGGLEKMQSSAVVKEGKFKGVTLVPGAGHWVQQEQPARTAQAILEFIEVIPLS